MITEFELFTAKDSVQRDPTAFSIGIYHADGSTHFLREWSGVTPPMKRKAAYTAADGGIFNVYAMPPPMPPPPPNPPPPPALPPFSRAFAAGPLTGCRAFVDIPIGNL